MVFLGNSRLQFGFSAPATGQFFADVGASYYLLGFSDNETFKFTGPLLKSLQPKARAYVINVDKFFFDRESQPAATDSARSGRTRRAMRTSRPGRGRTG